MESIHSGRYSPRLASHALDEAQPFHGVTLTAELVEEVIGLLQKLPNANKLITKNQFRDALRNMIAQNTVLAHGVTDLQRRNAAMGAVCEVLVKTISDAGLDLPSVPGVDMTWPTQKDPSA